MARAASAIPSSVTRNEPITWLEKDSPPATIPESVTTKAWHALHESRAVLQDTLADFRIILSSATSRAVAGVRGAAMERPLYFVGGVAAASFLVGVGLRLRRSSND
jgi:hypothetical protein